MTIALFTVIDLETTGLAPPASVIEIGVTRLYLDTETKRCEIAPPESRLFRPAEPMAPENIAVHHLTDAMLAGFEPCSDDALHEIVAKDGPQVLVAANAAFEQQWITPAIAGVDPSTGKPPHWLCTVKASARLHPDAESHSNQAIRYLLGLDLPEHLAMPPHRAGPDSFVTAHILARFLETTMARDLVQWTREPRHLPRVTFGKHKGSPWPDVPIDYLQWRQKQTDMDADVLHAVKLELERRRQAA